MISPQIAVRWKGIHVDKKGMRDRKKLWDPTALFATQKLIVAVNSVVMKIKNRVMVEGRTSTGERYKPLSTRGRIVVPGWYPQPRKNRVWRNHNQNGAVGGDYSIYTSRLGYQIARKLPRHKNFFASGGMWKGLQTKAEGPMVVRTMFAGSSPRMRPTKSWRKRRRELIMAGAIAKGAHGPRLEGAKDYPTMQKMQNRKKASGSAKNSGRDLLAFSETEQLLLTGLINELVGAYCLIDWRRERQGFLVREWEAKVRAIQKKNERALNKLMAKAGL